MEILTLILVPLFVAIVPSFISYRVSVRQASNELKILKEQQTAALQQLREQQENEINLLREQQRSEMEKIKYQSEHELEKMKLAVDKQAELHERTIQSDITKDAISKMIFDGEDVFGKLAETLEKAEALKKKKENGTFKNSNHPAVNKRR